MLFSTTCTGRSQALISVTPLSSFLPLSLSRALSLLLSCPHVPTHLVFLSPCFHLTHLVSCTLSCCLSGSVPALSPSRSPPQPPCVCARASLQAASGNYRWSQGSAVRRARGRRRLCGPHCDRSGVLFCRHGVGHRTGRRNYPPRKQN